MAVEDKVEAAGIATTERESALPGHMLAGFPIVEGEGISRFMAVSAVAAAWPDTRAVFERHGIPWQDSPVPSWEPIAQAAAVRGFGPSAQRRLLDELNMAMGWTRAPGEGKEGL
jgi:hypothetical protein